MSLTAIDEAVEKIKNTDADKQAIATAGLEELKLMEGGILTKISDLERDILYRSFYFPGGIPRLIKPGIGVDTSTVKYDNIMGNRDIFSRFDPRYIEDYIAQARQHGFHKNFLFFNGSNIEHSDFAGARIALRSAIDFTTGEYLGETDTASIYKVYGIISGIEFMDKRSSFIEEYATALGITTNGWKKTLLNGDRYVSQCYLKMGDFIGQTKDEFISNDFGISIGNNRKDLWFAGDLMQEWESLQVKYEEYKNRVWEILKNIDALNMCSNITSGVYVGTPTITQQLQCAQQISETAQESIAENKDATNDWVFDSGQTIVPIVSVAPASTLNTNTTTTDNTTMIIIFIIVVGFTVLGLFILILVIVKSKSHKSYTKKRRGSYIF
jgi:hypothetical protein